MAHTDTLSLIGNTPLVEVTCFDSGPCRILLKLESQNPGGSIKDRIGVSMIEDAQRRGVIHPGDTLVEATAGNTGLGLALAAAALGYRLELVIPDKMSREKIQHLRALGAGITMTRSDVEKGHPAYYQDYARALAARTPGAWFVDQFNNPANPLAHETGTGPEIWHQTGHHLDALVVGVGSGGTLGGLSRFFSRVHPDLALVLADPQGSILADYVTRGTHAKAGSWLVEGIGEDFIPPLADFSMVRDAYTVSDERSFFCCRELLRRQGILAGSSTGVLLWGALCYAREQTEPKTIVTFACDSGNKYLSKMYNDQWMHDHGFMQEERHGDLRDLIAARYEEGGVVSVSPTDPLLTAWSRMKLYDVSQLPVLDGERVVGLLDESDMLMTLMANTPPAFGTRVRDCMTTELELLAPDVPIEQVAGVLKRGLVGIVADTQRFYGLITRMDLVNHLRRQVRDE